MELNGKVAIVTGAASGIGRAVAQQLARQGAIVIAADLNPANMDTNTCNTKAVQTDVTNAEAVQKLVDEVVAEHGRLDYMFNNAGIGMTGELRDMTLEQWNKILDVNLRGVIHGVVAAYPLMVKQGYGHIVNTASGLGLIAQPTLGAYSTTKHAVVALTDVLRQEAAGLGVKASVVCPGWIQTGIFDASTYVKVKQTDLMENMPFKLMDVDKCAEAILRGVARNQAVITTPNYVKILWWLHRLSPALTNLVNRKALSDFRKVRK